MKITRSRTIAFLCALLLPFAVYAAYTESGVANNTAPTLTEGKTSGVSFDLIANLRNTLGTLISGEDQTNNVLRVEGQFSYKNIPHASTAVKTSAGYIDEIWCAGTDGTATAGSLAVMDSPDGTAGTTIFTWVIPASAFTTPILVPPKHVTTTNGIYLKFTTTADVDCVVSYR